MNPPMSVLVERIGGFSFSWNASVLPYGQQLDLEYQSGVSGYAGLRKLAVTQF